MKKAEERLRAVWYTHFIIKTVIVYWVPVSDISSDQSYSAAVFYYRDMRYPTGAADPALSPPIHTPTHVDIDGLLNITGHLNNPLLYDK